MTLGCRKVPEFQYLNDLSSGADWLREQAFPAVDTEDKTVSTCLIEPVAESSARFALEPHKTLYNYWFDFEKVNGLPVAEKIDPLDFPTALGDVMLIEPNPESNDFRYRVYGTNIAKIFGKDLTDSWVSEHPSPVAQSFRAQYKYAVEHRVCLYSENDAPPRVSGVVRWCRLILPFASTDGTVHRLLVGNVAANRQ